MISYNRVTWAATSLGALFDAYEIYRKDPVGETQIADVTPESTTTFKDYEALRNVSTQYRMRVRRTDGAVSDYTTYSPGVTAILATGRYVFVSNELAATRFVEANDLRPRTYTFPERAQTHEMYGRNGAVTFKALEDEGDEFDIQLVLAAQGGTDGFVTVPVTPGRAVFEPLRLLSRASASYVCVLDSDGNRWYSSITLTQGTRLDPGQQYTASLHVRETASVPSTPAQGPA